MDTIAVLMRQKKWGSADAYGLALNPTINSSVINIHTMFGKHFLKFMIANAIFIILAHSPKNNFALKIPTMEGIHILNL